MSGTPARPPQPLELQRQFWNSWNSAHRETRVNAVSEDESQVVTAWLRGLNRADLSILDVGCGTGWMSERLTPFGRVTGTDLADDVIAKAAARYPAVRFLAGDFSAQGFEPASFDVVVTLEVLSHVGDQPDFIARIARLLKPGGRLMLATQNKWVLERCDNIAPVQPGQLRRWVDRGELRRLLEPHFTVRELRTATPAGTHGVLRVVNSTKVNRLLETVVPAATIKRAKERLGCGFTLLAHAERRP